MDAGVDMLSTNMNSAAANWSSSWHPKIESGDMKTFLHDLLRLRICGDQPVYPICMSHMLNSHVKVFLFEEPAQQGGLVADCDCLSEGRHDEKTNGLQCFSLPPSISTSVDVHSASEPQSLVCYSARARLLVYFKHKESSLGG